MRLQKVKMRNDAINMEVNEGLLAFFAEEEGAVGGNLLCGSLRRWLEPSLLNGAAAE